MINDILTSDIVAPNNFTFTVDNTVLQVPIVAGVGTSRFMNEATKEWFSAGDFLLLDQITVNVPFGFGQGDMVNQANLFLQWEDSLGGLTPVNDISGDGKIIIPDLCHPIEFNNGGIFIKTPAAAAGTGKVRLVLGSLNFNVSMVNVPAALNTQVIAVAVLLQCRHTKALTLIP